MSTKDVAEAILTGKLPPDVWVAAPNVPIAQARWLRATGVPVIAALLEGIPTRRRKVSESGMRMIAVPFDEDPDATKIVEGPLAPSASSPISSHPITSSTPPKKFDATLESGPGRPDKGGTEVLAPIGIAAAKGAVTEQVTSPEEAIPETERTSPMRGPDGFPLPAFPLPEPTPTPTPTPSPSYYRGGETLESPGQERTPKKRSSA